MRANVGQALESGATRSVGVKRGIKSMYVVEPLYPLNPFVGFLDLISLRDLIVASDSSRLPMLS